MATPEINLNGPGSVGRWVVGYHAIVETFQVAPQGVKQVCHLAEPHLPRSTLELLKHWRSRLPHASWRVVRESWFKNVSESHQGMAVWQTWWPELPTWSQWKAFSEAIVLAVEGIQDPQNLGAIIRSAWLLGAKALMLTQRRSCGLSASVHKVASGGCEHVPVWFVNQLHQSLMDFQNLGYQIIVAEAPSRGASRKVSGQWGPRVVVVLGSEHEGLSQKVKRLADEVWSITQTTPNASLNVSVAAAIALWHYRQQYPLKG